MPERKGRSATIFECLILNVELRAPSELCIQLVFVNEIKVGEWDDE